MITIYKKAEKELAKLLGYQRITEWQDGRELSYYDNCGEEFMVPEWCSDDAEAFKLMVEYEVDIKNFYNSVYTNSDLHKGIFGNIDDHNQDRSIATRYAIVQAVISKLKGK